MTAQALTARAPGARRFLRAAGGAAMVEFGMLMPVVMLVMIGGVSSGLAFWIKNALYQAASEGARCIAIGSVDCRTVPVNCDSNDAGVCYVETMAQTRGQRISATNVSINRTATYNGVSATAVTITYPYMLLGYSVNVRSTGIFPNP